MVGDGQAAVDLAVADLEVGEDHLLELVAPDRGDVGPLFHIADESVDGNAVDLGWAHHRLGMLPGLGG